MAEEPRQPIEGPAPALSDQFFCCRPGGIKHNGQLLVMEGTAEKGPWYNAWEFSDVQIELWLNHGWVQFMEKKVK